MRFMQNMVVHDHFFLWFILDDILRVCVSPLAPKVSSNHFLFFGDSKEPESIHDEEKRDENRERQ
eukprot:CAMPEP_0184687288 /NCGR_PEP_ID=MMETSP0312-20130426/25872_1 /TAXON_ID=31354 /ORGANISM="Compsopogon coeruleus, Strain SAG 36.94" /LENGTH=64 /DNA_ID=CAMNT_0027143257 /DNA_START=46 /DNA_END=240 /DNA_ORIENTATION=-